MDRKRLKDVTKQYDYQKIIKNAEQAIKAGTKKNDATILFSDPIFKPQISSLMDMSLKEHDPDTKNWKNITWKRASEIFTGEYFVFEDKVEMNDIQQGSLGN